MISNPRSGSTVRLARGDWLELRLAAKGRGRRWQVADKPGCLLALVEEPPAPVPATTGPMRTLGFLAFVPSWPEPQRLRLELVGPRSSRPTAVRDLEIVVA